MQIIDLNDHPHNLCPSGKLEWFEGDRSVYSVKAGFIAVIGYARCVDQTFSSKSEATTAARSASDAGTGNALADSYNRYFDNYW